MLTIVQRKDRIAQAFDKIKYVYSHIRSQAKLASCSIGELLNHADVRDVLGTSQVIAKPTKNQLSHSIKQYIDSGGKSCLSFVFTTLREPGSSRAL
jgi:hypothetical protein